MEKKLKIKHIILILLTFIETIEAKDEVVFSWEFANFGFGHSFSSKGNSAEFTTDFFNFFLDNKKTKTGIKLSPTNIRINSDTKEEWETITEMNFLNFRIYRDFLNEDDMSFGPFSSIQYINLRNWKTIDYKDITVNTGLKYVYKVEDIEKIDGKFIRIGMELGYRYNYYDKNKFYYNVSVDLIPMVLMIGKVVGFFWKNNETTKPAYYRIDYF